MDATKPDPALPTPAKKEDVVFQVTAANFQSLVLESPVPVVLDVYADWCGPCKQLGPVLEEAAIKAGGAFRYVFILFILCIIFIDFFFLLEENIEFYQYTVLDHLSDCAQIYFNYLVQVG